MKISAIDFLEQDNCHYGKDPEFLSHGTNFSNYYGFQRLGIHCEILPPGRRTSWPHAESTEEEFVFVVSGYPHAWINGDLIPLGPGDAVGFKPGTGIAHTFLNNTLDEVKLVVVGDRTRPDNQIHYPLHPQRNLERADEHWKTCPPQKMGSHDGMPDRLREALQKKETSLKFDRFNVSPEITLRKAQLSDAQALLPLVQQLKGQGGPELLEFSETLKYALSTPCLGILVAENSNGVMGYLSYSYKPQLRLSGLDFVIDELSVDSRSRSQGVGKALVAQAEATAKSLKAQRIILSTNRERESYERGFYKTLGFVEKNSAWFGKEL